MNSRGAGARGTSLLRYSPALVLLAITIADSLRFADPDLWGHITFGQAVLARHRLVFHDPYSYSAPGHLWLNHEWLSEVIDAFSFNALGVFGLKAMKLALTGVTVIFIALSEAESGASELAQLGVLLATAAILAPSMQFRPQLFTFALFAILMFILVRHTYRRAAGLWIAIPMLALWANLHGGFIMGIAALGTYAGASAVQNYVNGRGLGDAVLVGAVTLGAIAATLVTPYGIGTWVAVGHALGNPYTRTVVMDWQPLLRSIGAARRQGFAVLLYDALPLVLMAALAIAVAVSRDCEDLAILAIAALMSIAALVAMRNVPLAMIAIAAPLARHGARAAARLRAPACANEASATPRAGAMNQLLLSSVALAMLIGTGFFSDRLGAQEHYPAGAVAFMDAHHMHGNILDNFLWGEYLIWHTAPASKVFMDGRYDTSYPQDVVRAFLRFHFDRPGAGAILSRWPHDYVMLPPDDPANRVIARHPEWKLIYRDRDTLLYARAGSAAAGIPGEPIAGVNPPAAFP
ncbi:MAG TPA: hypothetical protein VMV27_07220 [Candidatus Binataceae bacterium]|nr:hypothetical protein [Candidatus Binataceae bacterium]